MHRPVHRALGAFNVRFQTVHASCPCDYASTVESNRGPPNATINAQAKGYSWTQQ
ncbi:hypothetical protein BSU04_34330 [Caballeronia sordidicola]|uniref:Uncharacterized protein n=1 Tax=Caballeronia sordidicola TaxID=196367 RepID=A0A226WRZ7_CABSO|nr:hypothetical protein BSU04_34330 [Caballeronia sordidicola]